MKQTFPLTKEHKGISFYQGEITDAIHHSLPFLAHLEQNSIIGICLHIKESIFTRNCPTTGLNYSLKLIPKSIPYL